MKKSEKLLTTASLGLFFFSLSFRKWIEFTETEIIPSHPVTSLKLALVSDLHGYKYGNKNVKLFKKIVSEAPDYVMISGDLITYPAKDLSPAVDFVSGLNDKGFKTIYVLGNHELKLKKNDPGKYYVFLHELRKSGTILLDDFIYEDEKIKVVGYTNKLKQYRRFKKKYMLTESMIRSENGYVSELKKEDGRLSVLLLHNPVYFPEYIKLGPDLVLAGHLHGGLMRLPFIGGLFSPQTFVSTGFSGGLYQKEFDGKRGYMYVSRGLGLHHIHLRPFNRPELAFIKIG